MGSCRGWFNSRWRRRLLGVRYNQSGGKRHPPTARRLSLLIALTGRVPEKMGKDGAVYQPTLRAQVNERFVEGMLESPEPAVQRAAAATYTETRSNVEDALRRVTAWTAADRAIANRDVVWMPQDLVWDINLLRARGLNLETNTIELLRSRTDAHTTVSDERDGFDLIVRSGSGAVVAVEVKAQPVGSKELDKLVEKMRASNYGALVVVEGVRESTAPVRCKHVSPNVAVVTGPADINGDIPEEFEDAIFDTVQSFLNK